MELKPCPFCGEKAGKAMEMYAPGRWVHSIECKPCKVAFTNLFRAKEEAAGKWNHRPIEDQLRAELAAERARLEWCLKQLLTPYSYFKDGRLVDFTHEFSGRSCKERIPAGQTARDVIDRLIGEAGQ